MIYAHQIEFAKDKYLLSNYNVTYASSELMNKRNTYRDRIGNLSLQKNGNNAKVIITYILVYVKDEK